MLGAAKAATTDSAQLPAPTDVGFEVGSMLECLIDPECSAGVPVAPGAAAPFSNFVTTTTINGRPVTINVDDASPTGYMVAIHDDSQHTMNCHAGNDPPVTLTCDDPAQATTLNATALGHKLKLVGKSKDIDTILMVLIGVIGILALLALITCCCMISPRRRRGVDSRGNSISPTNEVTEITKTNQIQGPGTLGRSAEEGRSMTPFAGAAAGGTAAENAGRGSSGMGSDNAAGQGATAGQGAGAGQSAGAGQGTGAGRGVGQGGQAGGAGNAARASAVGSGTGGSQMSGNGAQGGVGQGVSGASSASADQTGSEVVDNGSMRGRRILRTGTAPQQVIA